MEPIEVVEFTPDGEDGESLEAEVRRLRAENDTLRRALHAAIVYIHFLRGMCDGFRDSLP